MKNLSRHEVYDCAHGRGSDEARRKRAAEVHSMYVANRVRRRAMKALLIAAGAFALAACLPVGKLLTGLFIIAAVLAAAAAMLVAG